MIDMQIKQFVKSSAIFLYRKAKHWHDIEQSAAHQLHPLLQHGRNLRHSIPSAESLNLNAPLRLGDDCVLRVSESATITTEDSFWFGDRCTVIIHDGGRLTLKGGGWCLDDAWIEVGANQEIVIGKNTTLQRRCELHGSVRVGNDCLFAPAVFVSSGGHTFDKSLTLTIREQDQLYSENKPVIVGDCCWIGIRAWVGPGVTVATRSVIGANSVVTKDTEDAGVYGGIPARKLRNINP
jgi:acetyltransferase-like isoleucine patch superfamily enzyme